MIEGGYFSNNYRSEFFSQEYFGGFFFKFLGSKQPKEKNTNARKYLKKKEIFSMTNKEKKSGIHDFMHTLTF